MDRVRRLTEKIAIIRLLKGARSIGTTEIVKILCEYNYLLLLPYNFRAGCKKIKGVLQQGIDHIILSPVLHIHYPIQSYAIETLHCDAISSLYFGLEIQWGLPAVDV